MIRVACPTPKRDFSLKPNSEVWIGPRWTFRKNIELEAGATPMRRDGLRHGHSLERKMGGQSTIEHAGEHLRRQESKSHDSRHERTGDAFAQRKVFDRHGCISL